MYLPDNLVSTDLLSLQLWSHTLHRGGGSSGIPLDWIMTYIENKSYWTNWTRSATSCVGYVHCFHCPGLWWERKILMMKVERFLMMKVERFAFHSLQRLTTASAMCNFFVLCWFISIKYLPINAVQVKFLRGTKFKQNITWHQSLVLYYVLFYWLIRTK